MVPPEAFRSNDWPSLGVEIELQLVDARSMALRSAIDEVLDGVPEPYRDSVKPEFMQCYIEINSGICRTAADVGADLAPKLRAVEAAADRHGVALVWAATHPFSRWADQRITPDERYFRLADQLQETVVRPVTFGLHVHVGVESGDRAVRVMDRLRHHLPLLLALSTNSPFWQGRKTGHHAHRIEVLEGFPTGGPPPRLDSWDDYRELVGQLTKAGFIESSREIWWDVRPSAENGTVEVRICDMPPDLPSVVALSALMQCLVAQTSLAVAEGRPDVDSHPMMARQNRWRACRYGLSADLVDPETLEPVPAREAVEILVDRLRGIAAGLGCASELDAVLDLASGPNGSERQIDLYERTGDLAGVVRALAEGSRLSDRPPSVAPRPPWGGDVGAPHDPAALSS